MKPSPCWTKYALRAGGRTRPEARIGTTSQRWGEDWQRGSRFDEAAHESLRNRQELGLFAGTAPISLYLKL
jgi:hypothetical protein